ncbi:MAG TPA: TonB-dependent receptor [Steroidobacteraceae bacterium]|nr:TonB-dependent receptor [Steroidobacteraceae bacterium]
MRAAVAAILGSATFMFSAPMFAADPASDSADQLEEVQVTGTRIQRRDFVSPNPVTTFEAADLERLGINNISDAITQVPQNVSQFTPANTGGSAFYIGSTLANLRGLNPFFGTRTLTLVDTRRFIPTTQGDAVDLNFIPSNLVQRVETVTGGASAAYGSGAISGVVNIILDKRLEGIKLDADYSVTEHGDGDNYRVGLAGGTKFADGRGHVVVGGEYQKMDAIQSCADERDWCGLGRGLYTNTSFFFGGAGLPFPANIAGQPHFIVTQGLRENQLSRSGVIFNGAPNATTAQQFNAAGTGLTNFAIGQQGWRGVGGLVVGGDGDRAYTNLTLQPNVERKTGFSHVEFDFNDNATGYAELSYGQVQGVNNQFGSGQNAANTCIRPDNAYLAALPASVRNTVLAADGNAPFNADNVICSTAFSFFPNGVPGTVISKNWQGQNLQVVTTDTKVTRGVLGGRGKLGDNWAWDAYYQYGKTTRDQIGSGYRRNWAYTFATDAVLNNAGQTVCRVTRDGLPSYAVGVVDPIIAQGCQPLNIFGTSAASAAGLAYAFGSLTEHNVIRQDVFAASLNGQLWEGWGAGPLSAAFGVEYRKDKLSNDAGNLPTPVRTDFSLQYGDSFAGDTKVVEGFAEFEMPLLKDLPVAKQLSLNAAVRQAQYKTSGSSGGAVGGSNKTNITTWKLAGVWDVVDWLRFRGSHSRDIRAPNFRELFYSQTIPAGGFFGTVANPWIIPPPFGNNQDPTVWQLVGNTQLDPEKAKTTTFGVVIQPVGTGLQFSADYYQIKLKGGLALALGGPQAVTGCFNGDQFFCSLLTFGAPRPDQAGNPNAARTNITGMKTLYTNQNPYTAKGLDLALNYRFDANTLLSTMPGSFGLNIATTHMIKQEAPVLRAGFVSGQAQLAGQTGGDSGFLSDVAPAADWTGTLALSYFNGGFTGTVQTRFVNDGYMDLQNPKTGPDSSTYNPAVSYSASDNTTGKYFLFNLNASYDLKWFDIDKFQVFGSINNLLDRDPPFSTGSVGGVNAINYDTLGRTYRLGVRMKF